MQITVYVLTWNEQALIEHTIRFYRTRFPDCTIVIYDNCSTDRTVEIAEDYDCQVYSFFTNDKISDLTYLAIKNHAWKKADSDWVVVVDCDEWLDIWPADLRTGATLIRSYLVNMINPSPNLIHPAEIKYGYRWTTFPGKIVAFNKRAIQEINYDYGAHDCNPIGKLVFSEKVYDLRHYKYLSLQYVLDRYKMYRIRLSAHNKRMKLGIQYLFSERKLRKEYEWYLKKSTKILP